MAYLFEYYQPTFFWLHDTQQVAIGRALLEEPLQLRKEYFSRFAPGTRFSGPQGHQTLREYLQLLEQKLREILGRHSVLYWLHLYRRIGPRLASEHSNNTDAMTTGLVRNVVECAISRFGRLADIGDIRPASLVPEDQILGGYFLRRLRKLFPERATRTRIVNDLRSGNQFVLREFRAADFVAIYAAEGIAYEYWLTTARLRSLGKGEIYVLQPDYDLQFVRAGDLDSLLTSYDERIERHTFLPVDIGTIVTMDPTKSSSVQILALSYNVGGDMGESILAALDVESLSGGQSVLNLVPTRISVDNFLASHAYLAEKFGRERGYSLKNFLLVVAALSWRVFMPEGNLSREIEGDKSATRVGILNALRRGYVVVDPERSSISRSIIWYLTQFAGLKEAEVSSVELELEGILSALTLDSLAKQDRISLWSSGPRYMLIPSSGAVIVDAEGVINLLRTLFVGFRDSEQERGLTFEEAVRLELKGRGFDLIQRRFEFVSGLRETDAAIRSGSTLWLIEAHSMWRPLDYEIGKIEAIALRVERFGQKLTQVASIRAELERAPMGENYDVRWARRIEHCVVSPFVEWVWSRDTTLWLNDETPRLLSVSELVELLTDESAKPID